MNLRRVILISQRFWPLTGPAEQTTAELADGLRRRGLDVVVLTARWSTDWSPEVIFRELPVFRLEQPPRGHWATWRYQRAISNWLRRHVQQGDLVLAVGLQHETYAAVGAVRGTAPVVARVDASGPGGELEQQLSTTWGSRLRSRSQQADAVVALCRSSAEELVAAGYAADRLHVIPPGAVPAPDRTPEEQSSALAMLAEVSRQFELPPLAPLVVCPGTLEQGSPGAELVAAWPMVLRQYPTARLCLIGIGPGRREILSQLRRLGHAENVLLPGGMDHLEELYAAADVAILPDVAGGPALLIQAAAAGIPLVAVQDQAAEDLLGAAPPARLVPVGDANGMMAAVLELLEDRTAARARGLAARGLVAERYQRERLLDEYVRLFAQLATGQGIAE